MDAPVNLQGIVPEYHSRNPAVRWLFRRRLDRALELGRLDGQNPLELLDLGCGEGAFLKAAQARYPRHRFTGWDVHPAIADLRLAGIELARVDILDAGSLPQRRFDRVFCLDVLEHFERLDAPLAAIRRLLKPGALLILSEPTESRLYRLGRRLVKGTWSAHEGPAAGPHYHDAAGVDRELRRSGFRRLARWRLPPWPLDLFHLLLYSD